MFHVLMIICFYESTAIRQRMEHRKSLTKSEFVELVNLDFGKYKNVSHYGFNAVCKEKQYDWVCYMVKIHHTFCCRLLV